MSKTTGASLGKLHTIIVGGSSAPPATIRWFRKRGIRVRHLWGMTEMSPIGTVGAPPANWDSMSDDEQVDYLSRPGRSMFGVELRVVDDDGQGPAARRRELGPSSDARAAVVQRYFKKDRGLRRCGQLVRHRRHRRHPSRQHAAPDRPGQGRDQVGRRVDQLDRARKCRRRMPGRGRGRRDRHSASEMGRAAAAACRPR